MQAPLDFTSLDLTLLPTEMELQRWGDTLKQDISQRANKIVKEQWANNLIHASYFSGKPVLVTVTNSAGETGWQWRQMSFDDTVFNFKKVLSSHNTPIIKDMWVNNPNLVNYFSNFFSTVTLLNDTGVLQPQIKYVSIEQMNENFKKVMASHCTDIIDAIWDKNAVLRMYFSGFSVKVPVVNTTMNVYKMQDVQLDINDVVGNFKSALASLDKKVIDFICRINPDFISYFSGMPTDLPILNSKTGQTELKRMHIPMDELLINFKAALACRKSSIINLMRNENTAFASYFSGLTIESRVVDLRTGMTTKQKQQITKDQLLDNFRAALSSQCSDLIMFMWDNNEELRTHFSADSIELLPDFRAVLASRCTEAMKAFWSVTEKSLQNEIENMQDADLKVLIDHVFTSWSIGKSDFIKTFLNSITKRELLQDIVTEKSTKIGPRYTERQIKSLKERIDSLAHAQQISAAVSSNGMFRGTKGANNKRFKPNDTDKSNSPNIEL